MVSSLSQGLKFPEHYGLSMVLSLSLVGPFLAVVELGEVPAVCHGVQCPRPNECLGGSIAQ